MLLQDLEQFADFNSPLTRALESSPELWDDTTTMVLLYDYSVSTPNQKSP